jgi:hypothetical protein
LTLRAARRARAAPPLAAGRSTRTGCPRREAPAADDRAAATTPAAAAPPAAATPAAPATQAFDRTLSLLGVTFRVTSPNDSSMSQLTIAPTGLAADTRPIVREVDGVVTMAEISDIDVNGLPEIWVYVQSAGSGSYGSLVAYAVTSKKTLSEIRLPSVTDNPTAGKGYMGHDEFRIVENTLVQRFPIYREGDTNAAPSGGTRQLQYTLVPDPPGWVLKLGRISES